MNNEHKLKIVEELKALSLKDSQNKVSKKAGVSSATISQMMNQNWDLIKDELWRKVQVNLHLDFSWNTASTQNLKAIVDMLGAVQSGSMSIGVSQPAGIGKSHSYKYYTRKVKNVILVECKNYWTKRTYVKELMSSSGLDTFGTTEELIEKFIEFVKGMDKPLIIIDQADKLKDPSLDLFMDFYNELDGHCGFLLSGVPALQKRILKGVQKDKIGYCELWSRIGRKFVALKKVSASDVEAICIANGIEDMDIIDSIWIQCEGDLRRVKREVEKYYLTHKMTA